MMILVVADDDASSVAALLAESLSVEAADDGGSEIRVRELCGWM